MVWSAVDTRTAGSGIIDRRWRWMALMTAGLCVAAGWLSGLFACMCRFLGPAGTPAFKDADEDLNKAIDLSKQHLAARGSNHGRQQQQQQQEPDRAAHLELQQELQVRVRLAAAACSAVAFCWPHLLFTARGSAVITLLLRHGLHSEPRMPSVARGHTWCVPVRRRMASVFLTRTLCDLPSLHRHGYRACDPCH